MEKKKIMYVIIALAITLVVMSVLGVLVYNHFKYPYDAKEFIKEYESLNDNKIDNNAYYDLDIDDDVLVMYKTAEEILDIINNKEDAMIYFGFSDCPWCRNMLGTLTEATADKKQIIYYVDIKEIRNVYEVVDDEIVETTKGDSAYYELLDILSDNLSDYSIKDDNQEEYQTNTKRIYGPSVITLTKGELKDIHVGTHEDVVDPYIELTDSQEDELYAKFISMISGIGNSSCSLEDEIC